MNEEMNILKLERMALGEIETPPECEAAVAALRLSNEQILSQYHPTRVAIQIREKLSPKHSRAVLWKIAPVAIALAAVPLIWIKPPGMDRAKGSVLHLHLYRAGAHGPERLLDQATVRPGDRIQASYVVGPGRYGAVFSVDSAGKITLHLPESGLAVELVPGKEAFLPTSFELDGTPGSETFYFVSGDGPFDARKIAEAARAGTLQSSLRLERLELRKSR